MTAWDLPLRVLNVRYNFLLSLSDFISRIGQDGRGGHGWSEASDGINVGGRGGKRWGAVRGREARGIATRQVLGFCILLLFQNKLPCV